MKYHSEWGQEDAYFLKVLIETNHLYNNPLSALPSWFIKDNEAYDLIAAANPFSNMMGINNTKRWSNNSQILTQELFYMIGLRKLDELN